MRAAAAARGVSEVVARLAAETGRATLNRSKVLVIVRQSMVTPLSVLLKLTPYFYRRVLEIAKEFFPTKASARLLPAWRRIAQKGKVIDIWQVVLHYPDDTEIANWQPEKTGRPMLNSLPRGIYA
jgi:hypothetical protein